MDQTENLKAEVARLNAKIADVRAMIADEPEYPTPWPQEKKEEYSRVDPQIIAKAAVSHTKKSLLQKIDAPADFEDARMKWFNLWAHLCARHSGIFDPKMTYEELLEEHEHEHAGPGTIRDHAESSRWWSTAKLGSVLSESDDNAQRESGDEDDDA